MAAQGKAKRTGRSKTTSRARDKVKTLAHGGAKVKGGGRVKAAVPTKAKTAVRRSAKRATPAKTARRVAAKIAGRVAAKTKARAPAKSRAKAPAKAAAKSAPKAAARQAGRSGNGAGRRRKRGTSIPAGYRPSDQEEFMGARQREYFRRKLVTWRDEIRAESRETIEHLREQNSQEPDFADRATIETERLIELRTRDRERKLLSKIDAALLRIEEGSYGFCLETGDPISLKRLEARPIATLSIDAQERHERLEKTYRDD